MYLPGRKLHSVRRPKTLCLPLQLLGSEHQSSLCFFLTEKPAHEPDHRSYWSRPGLQRTTWPREDVFRRPMNKRVACREAYSHRKRIGWTNTQGLVCGQTQPMHSCAWACSHWRRIDLTNCEMNCPWMNSTNALCMDLFRPSLSMVSWFRGRTRF